MPQTPYHLYRATDANNYSEEGEDLQPVKDWRDINAPGTPILDITIKTRTYYNVKVGNQTHGFPDDEQAAITFRDQHAPGTTITTSQEDYESEPFATVEE